MFLCLLILAAFLCLFLCVLVLVMALCSRCPVGFNGSIFLVTWARCSWFVSCIGSVWPPVVVELWFLLSGRLEGLTLRLIACEEWLDSSEGAVLQGLTPTLQDLLWQGSGACRVCPLCVLFVAGERGSALVWSEAGHLVFWLTSLLESTLVHAWQGQSLPWATRQKLQTDLQMVATSAGLGGS